MHHSNPFIFSGPLSSKEMIARDAEASKLLSLAEGGHSFRVVAPRRYGKTTLLLRLLQDAEDKAQMVPVLVDLEGVLSLSSIVVRVERAYAERLTGSIRAAVDRLFRNWNIGLSLGAGGFALALQSNPAADPESVLLRLLSLPAELKRKTGLRSLIVFDEIQDVLRVDGVDGIIRSVIQHQRESASYGFSGSAPGLMKRLFEDPSRPLLEQAVPLTLDPLPIGQVADYIESHFKKTDRLPGEALSPLVEFARGHPQRSMLLAHYLWNETREGSEADEDAWAKAHEGTLRDTAAVFKATWGSLSTNEQRVATALATTKKSLASAEVTAIVGLKKGSAGYALESLRSRGDIVDTDAGPRLTDPLFELWLKERGPW